MGWTSGFLVTTETSLAKQLTQGLERIVIVSRDCVLTHKNETAECRTCIIEPRHDKTCFREFPTRPDTNRPAQPQKLARVLKFRL